MNIYHVLIVLLVLLKKHVGLAVEMLTMQSNQLIM